MVCIINSSFTFLSIFSCYNDLIRWMFEKYDGIRGFWNPHLRTFFSRTGKPFLFPSHIIDNMPLMFLDGELWYLDFFFKLISHTFFLLC
jgi:hypothetical protein